VNAQLIDASSGTHLWADRFDGDRSRLGQLQDDVTARLARALNVRLIEAESLRAEREHPENPDAVDLAMRGWAALNHGRSRENYMEARAIFERALSIDPKLQRALDGLGYTLGVLALTRWTTEPDQDIARASKVVATALDTRPDDPIARMTKGYIFVVQKRFEDAVAELETAIASDRNLAEAYGMIAASKTFLGRADEAFAPVETAMRLSPRDPLLNIWLFYKCHAYTHLGQDIQAIEWCRKSVAAGSYWVAYVDLASAYAWTGQKEQAQDAVRELLKLMPGYTVKKWATAGWSNNPVFLKQYARIGEGLGRAGLPEQ
jgi:tetratricopeptide (TPR) repeat protein